MIAAGLTQHKNLSLKIHFKTIVRFQQIIAIM